MASIASNALQFIGVDLHTNKFTCCYRVEGSEKKETATFNLTEYGLANFYQTLTSETYVLVEATITTFAFVRLIAPMVKEVIIANTYELKQISLARKNTDKIDADILCRVLKMQVLSGEQTVSPVTVPPKDIQDLRTLFSSYRLMKKQITQTKNRIHSLLKEQLYGFTQEEIFSAKKVQEIRNLKKDIVLSYQLDLQLKELEFLNAQVEKLMDMIKECAEPYMREIEILTSLQGISVFIAIAIIADIIDVNRFKNSKAFTSYLRSAPIVSNSNTSISIRGTNKKGRKLSATLITQSLNHFLNSSEKLDKWYKRLTEYKKAGLVRTALRRRVFAEIFQMLKKGESHYGRDAQRHEFKMKQYRRFLEKRRNLSVAA
jgi:transposase